MAQGYGIAAGLAHGEHRARLIGEPRLLGDDKVATLELGGDEEVDIEGLAAIVGIDEMAILGVVLHAGAHAAPHALVGLGVDAIALRTKGGEIDIATGTGILRGEDMVPQGVLVEVDIAGIGRTVEKHLGEL